MNSWNNHTKELLVKGCPEVAGRLRRGAGRIARRLSSIVFIGLILFNQAVAGEVQSISNPDQISLEQLVNMDVTSVSKKETRLNQSPAAIYVITQDDIRRSGMTSLPELLRMVPGMDVARIDGNEWAASARGFNGQFANKLLVLIDGRTVYTPASAGVFWNAQDVVLEDLDRIEVIRGPGAALWGANAVDGVINIITKSAKETQGVMVATSVGTEDQPATSVRYGGMLATNLYFRVYTKYFDRDGLVTASGKDAPDNWSSLRGGFRVDWEPSDANNLTLQGDYYNSDAEKNVNLASLTPPYSQSANVTAHNNGGNVLGRWTHTFSETSLLTLQTYFDHVRQDDGVGSEYHNTGDVDLQYQFSLGARNNIVWGAGYRYTDIENTPSFNLTWTPESHQLHLYNTFAQDDITLVQDRFHFIIGSKFEHNDLTGFEFQPSARLLWTPTDHQTVWAAVSRAIRTPSLFERYSRLNVAAAPGLLVSQFGNPDAEDEHLMAYELGYRIQPVKQLSFDLSTFYNVYDDLIVYVGNPPGFETSPAPPHTLISSTEQNADHGETYGGELSVQWQVTDHWRLAGSYSLLKMQLRPDPSAEQDSPQQQFQIRSGLDLPHDVELNGAVYYVDQISPQSGPVRVFIPSYIRCDLGVAWHPTKSLEIGIWGQNLLDSQHAEYASLQSSLRTEVPRSFVAKIIWRF